MKSKKLIDFEAALHMAAGNFHKPRQVEDLKFYLEKSDVFFSLIMGFVENLRAKTSTEDACLLLANYFFAGMQTQRFLQKIETPEKGKEN